MNKHFQRLKNNVLIKVGSLNAIAVIVKAVTTLIGSKIIAVILGAEGMALLGNLRNVSTSIQSIGNLGLYNGVVKYVAEFKDKGSQYRSVWATCLYACLIASVMVSLVLWFGNDYWSEMVFGKGSVHNDVIKLLALLLPLYTLNTLLLGVINGLSKYKLYVIINIITSCIALIITVSFIKHIGLTGAFLAVVVNPAISLVVTITIIRNRIKEIFYFPRFRLFSFKYLKKFVGYSIMALFSSIMGPMVLIWIRNYMIINCGLDEAGYWEGIRGLSNQYMMFINTLLTLYLLPKLSEDQESSNFRHEVFNFYKIVLPLFCLGFLAIYFSREFIVRIFLSSDFLPMTSLFSWQLMGDFLKITSSVLACQFLAKRMIWHYLITEMLSFAFLYLSSVFMIDKFGFIGVSVAYFLNYIFYLMMLVLIFRKKIFGVI